jgi:hypothetical protein
LFGFPDSGVRHVPVEMDGVPGLNTVSLFHAPNTVIHCGEEFEGDCRVIWEEGFYPAMRCGATFRVWDGRFIASGEVSHVYRENWKVQEA